MSKVTMKINKDVYKALQKVKIDMDTKSLSDTIAILVGCEVTNDTHESKIGKSRRVSQYTTGGAFIKTFPSIMQAGKYTGADSTSIGLVCMGSRNSAGGYFWGYASEAEELNNA